MNFFKPFMQVQDKVLIDRTIVYATKKLSLPAEGVWCCVGSRVIGLSTSTSDVDLLFISKELTKFERISTEFENVKISICALPHGFLRGDAYEGKYGGYFAAKMFVPHFVIPGQNAGLVKDVLAAPAVYFSPFLDYMIRTKSSPLNSEALTAMAVIAFMNICPEYDKYFFKLFIHPEFESLWAAKQKQFYESIENGGIHFLKDRGIEKFSSKESLQRLDNFDDFYRERAKRASRFWSFCVYTHGGDPQACESYRDGSITYIEDRGGYVGKNYEQMVNFLFEKTHRKRLFI